MWEDGVVAFRRCTYDQTPLLKAIAKLPLLPATLRQLVALFEGRWRPEI
jgi:hypothetical protein